MTSLLLMSTPQEVFIDTSSASVAMKSQAQRKPRNNMTTITTVLVVILMRGAVQNAVHLGVFTASSA